MLQGNPSQPLCCGGETANEFGVEARVGRSALMIA